MADHIIKVRNREISVTNAVIVANSVNSDKLLLDLDDEWKGLQVFVTLELKDTKIRSRWGGMPLDVPEKILSTPGYVGVTIIGRSPLRKIITRKAKKALVVVPSGTA